MSLELNLNQDDKFDVASLSARYPPFEAVQKLNESLHITI